MKIGSKLIVMIVALSLSGIGILLITITSFSHRLISTLMNSELEYLGKSESAVIKAWIDDNFSMVRTIAVAMEAYEQIPPPDRRFIYNLLMKMQVEANPDILSIWSRWEPNALDGMDAEYANTEGTDETGRFISYFIPTPGYNGVSLTALEMSYDGVGDDFYTIPKRTGKETILEPYFFNVNGQQKFITSLIAPIKKHGMVIGVVGIDVDLAPLQAVVEEINPHPGTIAAVFSNESIAAAHFIPSRIGSSMEDGKSEFLGDHVQDFTTAVKKGTSYKFDTVSEVDGKKEDYIFISIPIYPGVTETPWAVAFGVPEKVVNEPIVQMLLVSIGIAAVMIIIMVYIDSLQDRPVHQHSLARDGRSF
ncbi:MAG: hypothetical protein LBD74_05200 [Spirochaetaceae bacterium]|jgi:methyl-accepting chemotaxis protein|nr:hypothetical protein [Spirochaetaceae bacterium]